MNWIPTISSSTIDAIDLFCGYGGWSTALGSLGVWVRRALNHNANSIYVHNLNHPHTSHHLGDVKNTHPGEHPHTALFAGSAACTDFSQADPENIKTLMRQQLDMFDENMDPIDYEKQYEQFVAQHQGRTTMFDIIRFVAYHKYHYGITENVVEVNKWVLFPLWKRDLANLGYEMKFLHLNSMFFHELNGVTDMPIIPQSRDRWYCVFWRKGNPPPQLDFFPLAPCPNCGDVRAIQVWKNPKKQWGRYGLKHGQYYYGCPRCTQKYQGQIRPLPVEPYYFAGINTVDWSVPIYRVDDPNRGQVISDATRRRIASGLEKYGYEPLILDIHHTQDGHIKHRSALLTPLFAQTGTATQAICMPPVYLTDAARGGHLKGTFAPLFTLTSSCDTLGVATVPFLVTLGGDQPARSALEPANTMTTIGSKNGVALAPTFFVELYNNGTGRPPTDPINTVTAFGGKTGVAIPAFFTEQNSEGENQPPRTRAAHEALNTVSAGGVRTGLAVPFFTTYNEGHSVKRHGGDALPAMTTVERHGMTWPRPTVDECYYRTLRSKIEKTGNHGAKYITSEIGAAMGFPQGPDGYDVGQSNSDHITYGYGNAITPGLGKWALKRILDVMQ